MASARYLMSRPDCPPLPCPPQSSLNEVASARGRSEEALESSQAALESMKKKLEVYKRENKNLLSSYDQWWVLLGGRAGGQAGCVSSSSRSWETCGAAGMLADMPVQAGRQAGRLISQPRALACGCPYMQAQDDGGHAAACGGGVALREGGGRARHWRLLPGGSGCWCPAAGSAEQPGQENLNSG